MFQKRRILVVNWAGRSAWYDRNVGIVEVAGSNPAPSTVFEPQHLEGRVAVATIIKSPSFSTRILRLVGFECEL